MSKKHKPKETFVDPLDMIGELQDSMEVEENEIEEIPNVSDIKTEELPLDKQTKIFELIKEYVELDKHKYANVIKHLHEANNYLMKANRTK